MLDPWRHVDADDDVVADLLAGSVEAVVDLGGWVHPSAVFVVRDGEAHVEAESPPGEPLLRVPSSAFLPLDHVTWSTEDEALAFADDRGLLSPEQWELLTLQVAFHNACGKLPRLVRTHPAIAPDVSGEVVHAVRRFRPSFREHRVDPVSVFWSNRAFRLPTTRDASPQPVAVPLIDLLDHRSDGATGTWTGDGFEVSAATTDGRAHLNYGLERDAIGMAVVYGFADTSVQCAHAMPMDHQVPGHGRVIVEAKGRSSDATLLPTQVRREDDAMVISHVTFRAGSGVEGPLDRAVVTAIAEANLEACEALIAATRGCASPAAVILEGAARQQAAVIRSAVGRLGA